MNLNDINKFPIKMVFYLRKHLNLTKALQKYVKGKSIDYLHFPANISQSLITLSRWRLVGSKEFWDADVKSFEHYKTCHKFPFGWLSEASLCHFSNHVFPKYKNLQIKFLQNTSDIFLIIIFDSHTSLRRRI